jgi:hypothetical protein
VDIPPPTTLPVQDTLYAAGAPEHTVHKEETPDVDPQLNPVPKDETIGVQVPQHGASSLDSAGVNPHSGELVALNPTGLDQWVGVSGVPGGMARRGVEAATDMSRVTYRVTVHTSSISGRSLGGFPYIEIEGTLCSTGLQVSHTR